MPDATVFFLATPRRRQTQTRYDSPTKLRRLSGRLAGMRRSADLPLNTMYDAGDLLPVCTSDAVLQRTSAGR